MMEWDEQKRKRTLEERDVDFASIIRFDWASALTKPDTRGEYGEDRFVSLGSIDGRLHIAVWTIRRANERLISLRKANARERKNYEQAQKLYR